MRFIKLVAALFTIGTTPSGMVAAQPIELWNFPTGDGVPVPSSPALSSDGKVLYIGSDNGKLYAITALNGTELWSFETGAQVWDSPALSIDGKVVYVGSFDHKRKRNR